MKDEFFDRLKRFGETDRLATDLTGLLQRLKKVNGTELRITPGLAAQTTVKGRAVTLADSPLEAEACRKICHILFTAEQKAEFEKIGKIQFIFGIKGIGRFKADIVSAEGNVSKVFTLLG